MISFKQIVLNESRKVKSEDLKRKYYNLSLLNIESLIQKYLGEREEIKYYGLMTYIPSKNRAVYVILTHDNVEDEWLLSKVIFQEKNGAVYISKEYNPFKTFDKYEDARDTIERLYDKNYKNFI